MKALTVQQPWAWSIIHGGKDVENRTTLWRYRGPLAIHAAARWSKRGGSLLPHAAMMPFLTDRQAGRPLDPAEHPDRFVFRALIGVVDLIDVHYAMPPLNGPSGLPLDRACCESPWAEQTYDHSSARPLVHLIVENPRALPEPIPATGTLGLWTPVPEHVAALEAL